jgi:hypothetical protein
VPAIKRSSGSVMGFGAKRIADQARTATARNDNCGPMRNRSQGFIASTTSAAPANKLSGCERRRPQAARHMRSTTIAARTAGGSAAINSA